MVYFSAGDFLPHVAGPCLDLRHCEQGTMRRAFLFRNFYFSLSILLFMLILHSNAFDKSILCATMYMYIGVIIVNPHLFASSPSESPEVKLNSICVARYFDFPQTKPVVLLYKRLVHRQSFFYVHPTDILPPNNLIPGQQEVTILKFLFVN